MARKTEKGGKFRNVHCRTWNMTRKLKIIENEKHLLDDLKNDEITKKRLACVCHSLSDSWFMDVTSRSCMEFHGMMD